MPHPKQKNTKKQLAVFSFCLILILLTGCAKQKQVNVNNQKSEYGISVVEKKINIDGNEAMVTHQADMLDGKISGEIKQPKATVFIKDNKLFIISTEMHDCEKVWNSFKFDK